MPALLKALHNGTNQAILCLLAAEPSYVRRTAALLGRSESEVTRRLRQLERLGVVSASWSHIGRNVKMYRLAARRVQVGFRPDGIAVDLVREDGEAARSLVEPRPVEVPDPGPVHGREQELAALDAPVVVVHGLPGIGKTSLVARHARQCGLPVFWHAFRGVESLHWLVNRLAVFLATHGDNALLEAAGAEAADQHAHLLHAVGQGTALVVLDDAHRIDDPAIHAWLRDAVRLAGARLVIVGRRPFPVAPGLAHARTLHVAGIAATAARHLLEACGIDARDEDARTAHEVLGGHPLALRLAADAALLRDEPLDQVLARLPAEGLDDYLLDEIEAHLSDGERLCLTAASVYETDFTAADVRAVQPKATRGDLLRLRRHGLVMERAAGRFALHEVVRLHFRARLDNARPLHARAAERLLGMGTIEGHLGAMHHYLEAGRHEDVMRLLSRNLDVHDFSYIDAGYARLYERLLGILDDVDLPPRLRAIAEDEKGDLCFARGDHKAACRHYEAAYAYFEAHPDGWEDEDLAWKRALALRHLGRRKDAARLVERALPQAPEGRVRERLRTLLAELR